MDPLSITSGVVGLLAVVAEVTKAVKSYISTVREQKQDIRDVHQELLLLGGILGQLRDFLSTRQTANASFDDDSVLCSAMANCGRRLERVGDRLKASSGGKLARTLDKLKWPFEQDEVKKLVESLQRCAQTFQFALTTKGLAILSKAADTAEIALHEQRASFQKIMQTLREDALPTAQIEAKIAQSYKMSIILPLLLDQAGDIRDINLHLRLQEEREQARQKTEVLEWLAPAASLQRHVETQRKRVSHTCKWFLQSEEFRKWQSLRHDACDMLCLGGPGVGKTILASFVFDELRTKYHNQNVFVVNYYCSHFEEQEQVASHLAKVVLRQICQALDQLPSAVLGFYRATRHTIEDVLWAEELQSILCKVLSTCDHAFLVLDALDEVDDLRERNTLLKALQHLRRANTNLRILVTSRPHFAQIQAHFHRPSVVDIAAHPDDVQRYLKQRLTEHPDLELIDDGFQEDIVEKLASTSSGTFLLPALQMNNVLQQITKADMRRALERLSETLDEAFRNSLDRIRGIAPARRDLAFRTMTWISYARRPLRMQELQQALATREGEEDLDDENIVPGRVIIESCAGLVQVDRETDTVSFFHFSIDEYLRSQAGILAGSELLLARTCLSYLLHTSLKTLPMLRDDTRTAELLERNSFFRYAAYHWGMHVRELPVHLYSDLALRLLNSSLHILAISRLRHLDNPYAKDWERQATPWAYNEAAGISIAAYFGLADLVELLITRLSDKTLINKCRNVYGNLPLQEAAGYGHTDVCEVLIAHGGNLVDNNWGKSTPFYHAVAYGRMATAKALLKLNRAQLDVHCRGGWTALHKASDLGDEAMVEFLLREGALVAAVDEKHRTALHLASHRGHIAVVRYLVQAGADVNASSFKDTSLDVCSTSGFSEVAQYLIDQGAIVDHRGRDGWSPLFRACRGGHIDVVRILLRAGADVLYEDHYKNSCLFLACRAGDIAIVKALLEHDPTLQLQLLKKRDQRHGNAQQIALITAHIDIYKYLRDLENQLDTDSSPLQFQIYNPSVPLARLIEAKDLTAVETLLRTTPELLHRADGSGQLPIHTAFVECAVEIAAFLLGLGASIHSVGFHSWTPLHISASIGSLELTELALKHGADLEARTGTLQTPLLKAVASSSAAVVRRLLEAGADIRARNNRGMTCLHVAASKKSMDSMRELLQPGWNAQDLVHARDRNERLPEDWADKMGYWQETDFLRLRRKLTANPNGGRSKSWTGAFPNHLLRTTTNTSQPNLVLPTPPGMTPTSYGIDQEADRFAEMLLESDSD